MTSLSDNETIELAAEVVRKSRGILAKGSLVVALRGDLGAGKTVFVQGMAKELGVERPVSSPSYVYVREYKFPKGRLVHADLWRVERSLDFLALKLWEYLEKGTIIAVEWPKDFLASAAFLDEVQSSQKKTSYILVDISEEGIVRTITVSAPIPLVELK